MSFRNLIFTNQYKYANMSPRLFVYIVYDVEYKLNMSRDANDTLFVEKAGYFYEKQTLPARLRTTIT